MLGAYLLGSMPFSYLVARRKGVDVRRVGSGNVGATNVMRNVGRAAGLIAFALDAAKGAVAAWCWPVSWSRRGRCRRWRAVMAVLGHMYPVWLRFRGGKGVATGAGAFLPLVPLATAGALIAFALALALTRYVSLGSIIGSTMLAVLAFLARRAAGGVTRRGRHRAPDHVETPRQPAAHRARDREQARPPAAGGRHAPAARGDAVRWDNTTCTGRVLVLVLGRSTS